MNKYADQSRTMDEVKVPRTHETVHPGSAPTHKEIARRAYEIYMQDGCRQGRSMQNWLAAEQELKNRQHWKQADRDVKDHAMMEARTS